MKIIDFCTGNAPIPLFLSTKTKSSITGIELQKEVFACIPVFYIRLIFRFII